MLGTKMEAAVQLLTQPTPEGRSFLHSNQKKRNKKIILFEWCRGRQPAWQNKRNVAHEKNAKELASLLYPPLSIASDASAKALVMDICAELRGCGVPDYEVWISSSNYHCWFYSGQGLSENKKYTAFLVLWLWLFLWALSVFWLSSRSP